MASRCATVRPSRTRPLRIALSTCSETLQFPIRRPHLRAGSASPAPLANPTQRVLKAISLAQVGLAEPEAPQESGLPSHVLETILNLNFVFN